MKSIIEVANLDEVTLELVRKFKNCRILHEQAQCTVFEDAGWMLCYEECQEYETEEDKNERR